VILLSTHKILIRFIMRMKNHIFILLSILLLYSCVQKTVQDNTVEVIHLNPHEAAEYMNLSEIADSVHCIRLQTDSGTIMGRIGKIIIKKFGIRKVSKQR